MRKIIIIFGILSVACAIYLIYSEPDDIVKKEPLTCENCNIIWLTIDAVAAEHFGLYGYERPTTPFLDKIAKEQGIVFENAISQSHWSLPSYSSMFTAKYPAELGLGIYWFPDALPPKEKTIAQTMRERGYQTQALSIGPFVQPEWNLDAGFDGFSGFRVVDREKGDMPGLLRDGISWIKEDRDKEQPFFLFFRSFHNNTGGRTPTAEGFAEFEEYDEWGRVEMPRGIDFPEAARTPEARELNIKFNEKGRIESLQDKDYRSQFSETQLEAMEIAERVRYAYDATIREFDMALEEFWKELEEMNLLEDTIIIINADHGKAFGQLGIIGVYTQLYDHTIRVPLIMFIPGAEPQRIVSAAELRALPPTFLDILGLEEESAFSESLSPAKSLKGHIIGEAEKTIALSSAGSLFALLEPGQRVVDFVGEFRDEDPVMMQIKVRDKEWLKPTQSAARSEKWSLILNFNRSVELYDLYKDPKQRDNLFPRWEELPSESRRDALEVIRELGVDLPMPGGIYTPRERE